MNTTLIFELIIKVTTSRRTISYRLQLRQFYFYEYWGQLLSLTRPFVNKLFSVNRIQGAVSIEASLYRIPTVVRLEGQA